MYTCGPTVYRYAHLGNLRTFLLADLLRRALTFEGYEVTQIMNITDVGHMTDESSEEAVDKMQLAAEDEGLQPLEIAEKYAKAVFEDAAAIGVLPASRYPKATEHIPGMIDLTRRLIDEGHAYPVEGGSVYYDVSSFPEYGKLSGQKIAKSTGNVVRVPELVERGLDPLAFRLLTFGTRYRSEMDFSWEAVEDANRRLRQLRNRMAEWAPAASSLGEGGRAFDRRFREALSNDLDMPTAVKIVNELVSTPDVPGGQKYALLASWDTVLGLDLERVAKHGFEPDEATSEKVRARDDARARKAWATSDRIRDELIAMGLEVMDTSEGTKVRPA